MLQGVRGCVVTVRQLAVELCGVRGFAAVPCCACCGVRKAELQHFCGGAVEGSVVVAGRYS
jgi:hypothetical protein